MAKLESISTGFNTPSRTVVQLAVVGLNLCSLALGYHLLVGVDDAGYLLSVFTYSVGEGSALDDVEVVKRDFYGGNLLIADVGGEGQRLFFEKILGCTATDMVFLSDFVVVVDAVNGVYFNLSVSHCQSEVAGFQFFEFGFVLNGLLTVFLLLLLPAQSVDLLHIHREPLGDWRGRCILVIGCPCHNAPTS